MLYSFQLEPEEVLGVAQGASLEEIRAAYREKAKKYHPDVQGDPWAFRILQRAHELLITARVATHVVAESVPVRSPVSPPIKPPEAGDEQVRSGIRDHVDDPSRLVDVELMLLRFEMHGSTEFFLLAPEDRNLSCNLNLSWPTRRLGPDIVGPDQPEASLKALHAIFKTLVKKTRPQGSHDQSQQGRYMAWLSYSTVAKTNEAFLLLHELLQQKGFGVDQRIRELIIPREPI